MKKNDDLRTPSWVYGALGEIDLDPCAGVLTNIGKDNYRVEDGQDGLELDWNGFVYCNPPFSEKEKWIRKFLSHDNGILVLPERGSAPWFGYLAQSVGCYFVMGKKIDFLGGSSSNNIGSCLFPIGAGFERIIKSGLPGHMVRVVHYNPR
jgi:hypothetical protein